MKQRFELHQVFSDRGSVLVLAADQLSVLVRAWEDLLERDADATYVVLNTERDVIVWTASRDALPLEQS